MEKKVIKQGYRKNGERVSVYEMVEKNEMTCAGIYLVVDGEWFEIGSVETAMTEFHKLCN